MSEPSWLALVELGEGLPADRKILNQTIFRQLFLNLEAFLDHPVIRNHQLQVTKPYFVTHFLNGFAFQAKRSLEPWDMVPRGTAEANHWVLFLGFVGCPADHIRVQGRRRR